MTRRRWAGRLSMLKSTTRERNRWHRDQLRRALGTLDCRDAGDADHVAPLLLPASTIARVSGFMLIMPAARAI